MTNGYGQKSAIGITFQNSFGTAGNVDSCHWLPYLTEGIGMNIPQLYSENIRGIYDEGDSYAGPKTTDGDIEVEAQPIALGAMLESIMQRTGSVNSGGIYTHTFKPRASDFDSKCANNPVTIFKTLDQSSNYDYFQDCTGTSLEIGITQGELLKAKVSYVGGTVTKVNSVQVASYEVGKRWKWDQSSVSIGGAANASVVAANITLDETLEAMHTLSGSNSPSRIKRTGFRSVAVDITMKFDDRTQYDAFLADTEQPLVIHCKGVTEIQSGYYEDLTIKLPLLRWEEVKPAAGGAGQIEVGMTGRGKYSTTSATALEITLVNTLAAYK